MIAPLPTADRLSLRLGFWAALGCVAAFVTFTAAFIGLLFVRPLFLWSDLAAYLAFDRAYPTWLPDLARLAMLLFGPLFVVVLNSVYDLAAPAQKSLARLALLFGLGFAVLTGAHYFVQLTAVRASIAAGVTDGLVQVVQANPYAAFAALNMLGWTLFLGLAALCAAPVFTGKGLARVIRYALVATGLICLLGGAGYLAQNAPLVFVTMNPAMGGAVLTTTVALSFYFHRRGQAE